MFNGFSNITQPTMNGLQTIDADSINSTTIQSEEINSTNIDTINLFVDGVNITEQVNINTAKLTDIIYNPLTKTTNVLNNFDVSGNSYFNYVNIKNSLQVMKNSQFNNNLSISGNLYVGINNNNTIAEINGKMIIRDPTNPNDYIQFFHDSAQYGYVFQLESPNKIMYFKVKDGATPGLYKTFYFAAGQMYSNIGCYYDNWVNISYNKDLTFGDNNGSNWYGGRAKFIPNSDPTSGLVFYVKGFNNNVVYYTNFTHNNLSNIETPTLRMSYAGIWSKVNHTFEGSLIGVDATFSSNLIVNGSSTLKGITGTTLNITGTSNFANTITTDSLSVYNGSNFNGNVNMISTVNIIGVGTFTGSAIFNNIATFNNVLNAQATTCSSLTVTGNILCGNLTASGNSNLQGNLTVNSGTINTIGGITTFSGNTTFINPVSVNNTLTINNNITQTGSTATTNKIIQPRISGDITGNSNILKYTQIRYNSGSSTDKPALQLVDDIASYALNFLPNAGSGSYGALTQANDRLIISVNNDGSPCALSLSTFGASTKHGIRIYHDISLNGHVQLLEGNYSFKINNVSGITASSNNTTSSLPDFNILSSGNRGLLFISNTSIGASNTFILANEAIITTNTQNNSSLVLTTSNSSLNYGIRIFTNASNNASITSQVGSNSIVTTQAGNTITGSTSIVGNILLSGTTTLLNNNILQYGSSTIYQDITGTYSGSNQLKNTNFVENIILNGSYIQFPDASRQTKAFNDTNIGYTLTGLTLTYPTGTIINCAVGGIGNEIKCHKFNCYNIVEFPDGSQQNTAYTNTLNTKLNAIGSISIATLNTTTLVSATDSTVSTPLSLTPGTYIVSWICAFHVIVGSTSIGNYYAGCTTSSSGFSHAVARGSYSNQTIVLDSYFSVSGVTILSLATTTNIYLRCLCAFGSASRVEFNGPISNMTATRIA